MTPIASSCPSTRLGPGPFSPIRSHAPERQGPIIWDMFFCLKFLLRDSFAPECPPAASPTMRFLTPFRLKLPGLKSILMDTRPRMFALCRVLGDFGASAANVPTAALRRWSEVRPTTCSLRVTFFPEALRQPFFCFFKIQLGLSSGSSDVLRRWCLSVRCLPILVDRIGPAFGW